MRFLMLNWRDPKNPLTGGAERASLAYLSALVARGHEVHWFANDFPGASTSELIDGIRYTRGGGKGSSVLKAISWYRRQPRFDLVIDQHHGIPWFAPWWCRTNCVAYIHEVLGPIWSNFYGWPLDAIGRTQERWTHRAYRNVPFWTVCEATRKQLESHGVKKVHVLLNGIQTRPVTALSSKTISQPLQLVAVSRLAPNKRIEHCILTLAELHRRNIRSQLTVIGGGEEEQKLRAQVVALNLHDHVRFAGALAEQEKENILQQSHFLLHTSVREGWGLNVIEANAMGTPAAVYPVHGLTESTLHDRTGLVSKVESPASLADELCGILNDDVRYQRLRVAAWKRADELQWKNVLPPACDWLESLARGER